MNPEIKAYEEKVRTDLKQVKVQLEELEARSKAEDKQVATDIINELKRTHAEIEKERQKLETAAVEDMEHEKAEIDAGIAKLRAGMKEIATKFNEERAEAA